jgi:hypothetical protein
MSRCSAQMLWSTGDLIISEGLVDSVYRASVNTSKWAAFGWFWVGQVGATGFRLITCSVSWEPDSTKPFPLSISTLLMRIKRAWWAIIWALYGEKNWHKLYDLQLKILWKHFTKQRCILLLLCLPLLYILDSWKRAKEKVNWKSKLELVDCESGSQR